MKRGYGKAVVVPLVLQVRVEFVLSPGLSFCGFVPRRDYCGLEETDDSNRLHDACLAYVLYSLVLTITTRRRAMHGFTITNPRDHCLTLTCKQSKLTT